MEERAGRETEDRGQSPDPVGGLRNTQATRQPQAWTLDGQRIGLEVALSVYSTAAVLRAAYKFTDRCYIFLAPGDTPGTLVAVMAPKKPHSAEAVETLVGEFANEALDQRVRESLAREFGPIQSLIAAQAFSEGNLLDPERDEADYRADPRGVGRRR